MREAKKRRRKGTFATLSEHVKRDRRAFAVFVATRTLVLAVMVRSVFLGQWENVFTCFLALFLLFIPSILEKRLKIDIPTALEIVVYVFVVCAEILGEIECFYLKFPFWDDMLHTVNGFMFAACGFCLVDIFNKNDRLRFELSPLFCCVVAFCFSMTIGVLWEFLEFGIDRVFSYDTQKDTVVRQISSVLFDSESLNRAHKITDIIGTTLHTAGGDVHIEGYIDVGLYDTMLDMFVNLVGAAAFSFIGYFHLKNNGESRIAGALIPSREPSNKEGKSGAG